MDILLCYCVRIHAYAQMDTHYLERLRDAVAIGSAAFAEWCGMTFREAGRMAGDMQYSAVSKAIRRLELQAAVDAKIRSEMSRLKITSNVEP